MVIPYMFIHVNDFVNLNYDFHIVATTFNIFSKNITLLI